MRDAELSTTHSSAVDRPRPRDVRNSTAGPPLLNAAAGTGALLHYHLDVSKLRKCKRWAPHVLTACRRTAHTLTTLRDSSASCAITAAASRISHRQIGRYDH